MADSSIPVEDGGTLEDNVQDDQSTNIDVATREVSAADTIASSSQPMVALSINDDMVHVDSYRYPRCTYSVMMILKNTKYAGRIL